MQQQFQEALFPFYFLINPSLEILRLGKSARKLFPTNQEPSSFSAAFEIIRPKISLEYEELLKHLDTVYIFKCIKRSDIQIKGQMILLAEGNLFFAFTPIVRNVSFFKEFGITMQDFPFYDTTLELLFSLQASQKALDEAIKLSKEFEIKVDQRTYELKITNDALLAQNEEYLQQQAQLNNQSLFLEEKNRKLSKARELIHAKNKELKVHSANLEKQVQQRTQELTNTNHELLQQNNQLEQFGFTVAHNLRAPIARVLGLINIMSLESLINPENQFYIDNIHSSIVRLEEVIHDLNAILDIRKGLNHLYQTVSLKEKVVKVMELIRTQIEDNNATITVDSSEVDIVTTIAPYLENIIFNLLTNAIKYKHEERPPIISVRSFTTSDFICICVQDNGIGFDILKNKDNLFRLYKRFHSHVEGKGLGLYMIKTQLQVLGGKIETESTVGEGTMFRVYLPKTIS
jgi:signal transduction histidine kinase